MDIFYFYNQDANIPCWRKGQTYICLSPDHRGLVRSLDVKFSGAVTMPPVVFEGDGNTPGGCLFLPGWRSFQSSSLLELSFSFPCRSPKRSTPVLLLGWASCCHLKHTISPKQATVPTPKQLAMKRPILGGWHFHFPAPPAWKTFEVAYGRLWLPPRSQIWQIKETNVVGISWERCLASTALSLDASPT